jgi:hypothetical protein
MKRPSYTEIRTRVKPQDACHLVERCSIIEQPLYRAGRMVRLWSLKWLADGIEVGPVTYSIFKQLIRSYHKTRQICLADMQYI